MQKINIESGLPVTDSILSENTGKFQLNRITELTNNETCPEFRYAVNTCGKNKDWDFEKLAANFKDEQGTIHDVASHIKQGHAVCAGLLKGKRRAKSNVAGAWWILGDIDNSKVLLREDGKPVKDEKGQTIKVYDPQLTIEQALEHPFIRQYCSLIYTTASHTPDWHKFRLVFLLPQQVDAETVECLTRFLMKMFPQLDESCKDASRVFYGATSATFPLINPSAVLPQEWVNEAIVTAQKEREEYQRRVKEIQERHKQFTEISQAEGWDIDQLIQQALNCIPPRTPGSGNYDECRQVLMALVDHYGEAEAEIIAERWSPTIPGTTWNIRAKIRSFRRSGISIGTLFHIAKQYGFRFPQRQYETQETRDRLITREEWETHPNRIKRDLNDFKSNFGQAVGKLASRVFKGFGERKPVRKASPALSNSADKFYKRKDRKEVWRSAVSKGWTYIIDRSATGTGKSYTVGDCKADDFDVERIFYLASDHRNPTTLPIEQNFFDLPTRHGGLVIDSTRQTPLGNNFLVNPTNENKGQEKTSGTCHRAFLFEKLAEKNLNNIKQTDNPICEGCHLLGACSHNSGDGFGFKHLRREALLHSELRAHPDSLPSPEDFNYPQIGLFWDEADTLFKATKKVTITLDDIEKLAGHLSLVDGQLHHKLKPVFKVLYQIISGEIDPPSYYGWNNAQIRAKLPQLPEDIHDIICEIQEALQPDFSFLQEKADRVEIEGDKQLSRRINRKFRRDALSENSAALNQVLINWLPDFLSVWAGERGAFKYQYGKFSIYTLEPRHREIAASAKFNIFLSTTLQREDLALMLGVSPDEILVIESKRPNFSNLKIIHVIDMGNLGKGRSPTMCDRVAALKTALTERHPDIAYLEWKAHADEGEGYHFRDGRGVNRFQVNSALASIGIPYPNVGDVLAEYQTLSGTTVTTDDDPNFQKYFDAKVQSELLQEPGRLRSHLRPDEELTYYFVGDYDIHFLQDALPGATITTVEAFTIAPEAGDKTQRTRWGILQVAKKLIDEGKKLGQTAVAKLAGITQGRLSQIAQEMGGWESFKKLLVLLLEKLYKTNNFSQSDELDEDLQWWGKNYLPLVVEEYPPEELVKEVAVIIKNYGWRDFRRLLEQVMPEVKAHLIAVLVSLLPEDIQQIFIHQFMGEVQLSE